MKLNEKDLLILINFRYHIHMNCVMESTGWPIAKFSTYMLFEVLVCVSQLIMCMFLDIRFYLHLY